MQMGILKGWHVVVLTFAALLLAVPLSSFVFGSLPEESVGRHVVGRTLPFVIAGLAVLLVSVIRRHVRTQLSVPIPQGRQREIGLVLVLKLMVPFAWMGAYVLWWNLAEGPVALMQRLDLGTHEEALQRSLSVNGIVVYVLLAATIGPIIEEIVYRGLLFPLWERAHGWFVAMLLSSTLFGLYHVNFLPAFAGSVILTCVYMRTRSLRASILVHAAYNFLVYYPLLGQFIAPRGMAAPGDPHSWALHIFILTAFLVAFPAYVWLAGFTASRDRSRVHVPVPG